jgi:hypothetical protein
MNGKPQPANVPTDRPTDETQNKGGKETKEKKQVVNQ